MFSTALMLTHTTLLQTVTSHRPSCNRLHHTIYNTVQVVVVVIIQWVKIKAGFRAKLLDYVSSSEQIMCIIQLASVSLLYCKAMQFHCNIMQSIKNILNFIGKLDTQSCSLYIKKFKLKSEFIINIINTRLTCFKYVTSINLTLFN